MEKKNLRPCGDKSRHIKIRYFFIKDILENDGINLQHYKTELMLADFLTEPLQGSLFKRMRDIIMGITPFPVEERVGKYRKVSKKTCKEILKIKSSSIQENMQLVEGLTEGLCANNQIVLR